MSSIFNRIFQYRQSEHKTSREDYFTETFVAVLNSKRCEPLRVEFASWLMDDLEQENVKAVRIKTQKSFRVNSDGARRRPDVWLEVSDAADRNHVAIIENKIDSVEGKNQLSDYARILEGERGAKSRTLVYITKYSEPVNFTPRDNVKFIHLKWLDVYRKLEAVQQRTPEEVGELPVELLRLMEDWNMDGTLSAAHLRAAVTCIGTEVGKKLQEIQNDAWYRSGIDVALENKWAPGRWSYSPVERGAQSSAPIREYGIGLWMGFRFDRRDSDWNVDTLELPSPAVTVFPHGTGVREMPRPSKHWSGPVEGMAESDLWVRQPVEGEVPRHGDPLAEYYRDFYCDAFTELKRVLVFGQ